MRIVVLVSLILLAALTGGVYGALYDQLTYSISPEFFTKFRFGLFNLDPDMDERMAVAKIGFINTWKTGAVLGGILAFAGLINANYKHMFKYTVQAFLITLLIAFATGMIGWGVGPMGDELDPDFAAMNIVDVKSFKTVLNMNNFSNAGGVIGMLVGIFHQLYCHKKYKVKQMVIDQELI